MRKLLTILSVLILTQTAQAVSRELLNSYSMTMSVPAIRFSSKDALISDYGINLRQDIRDFGVVKTVPYFKFQQLVTSYSKSKYCIPESLEISVFQRPIYYLPFLKNEIKNIMKSKGNVYLTNTSNRNGVYLWLNSYDQEVMGVINKTNGTQYVLSLCVLKGGKV